jgi:aminoglycoside 6-adenylyltransferase
MRCNTSAMDQEAVLRHVLEWARGEPNIRAVVLTGSIARGDGSADEHSDLDIELYVRDPSSLLDRDTWYRQFGEVLVVEELENPGWHPTRLVYYADGKIDFMVASVDVFGGATYTDPFQVLLDKDNVAAAMRRTTTRDRPPTADEYTRCVNWFYAALIMWATYLARSEPWAAKVRDWDSKRELLTMIEWDHMARYGWDYDTGSGGTHLRGWMDEDVLAAVTECWSDSRWSVRWPSCGPHSKLFDRLSVRTARVLGIPPLLAGPVRRRVEDILAAM